MRLLRRWQGTHVAVGSVCRHSANTAHKPLSRDPLQRLSRAMSATSPPPDYSTLSRAELLKRVTELEARLSALNAIHAVAPTSPKKKPKKPSKPFDPSRYSTRLIALKFAYLGGKYNGFEHHANNTTPLPTVEEEVWKALRKTKLILPVFREGQDESDVCWDGCEYSKCGRTDKGVSAFGQVIGIRVRSSQPKTRPTATAQLDDDWVAVDGGGTDGTQTTEDNPVPNADMAAVQTTWDAIRDELPYVQLLNRVLPQDIRILAWCPDPPPNFSARFNCKERRYRYFFTNPAYSGSDSCSHLLPSSGWLNIKAMKTAARKLQGLHDFRNFCKVDPSKQISNFERRVLHADIHKVTPDHSTTHMTPSQPQLYCFSVHGSAFLWHQVRHLVAVLFLVGQGYEDPSIVDKLLDVEQTPSKPVYDMASDAPLVLWDCVFPSADQLAKADHDPMESYIDALHWIYVGDEAGGRDLSGRAEGGKYGRNGIMDKLWALWRKRKIDEVLAGSLMDVVARMGAKNTSQTVADDEHTGFHSNIAAEESPRVFDGSDRPRTVGRYVPLMQRERLEAPDVVNARYAARKGLNRESLAPGGEDDVDE